LGSAVMQYSTEKEATAVVERHKTQVSMSEPAYETRSPLTLTKRFSPPNFLSFLHFYIT